MYRKARQAINNDFLMEERSKKNKKGGKSYRITYKFHDLILSKNSNINILFIYYF